MTQYRSQHQSGQPMAGCQSRSERPAERLRSYQDCHGARILYGPPRGKVAGANTFSWEQLSSNGAGIYKDGGISIKMRAGGRLVAVGLEFTRPLSSSSAVFHDGIVAVGVSLSSPSRTSANIDADEAISMKVLQGH